MGMIAAGLPVKIIMIVDVSTAADAVLAAKDIQSIKDLKGKAVAFEQGSTSDILINHALEANGMSIVDIQPVPMPASDVGGALIAGRVPAAVTYEPYISAARAQNKDIRVLFTAGDEPGLISDVLIVREEVLKSRPGQVVALLKAWDAALVDYGAGTEQGRAIIAESVGSNAAELQSAFDGVQFYSLKQNRSDLTGTFAKTTFVDVAKAARKAGILVAEVSAAAMIDGRFVAAP
jgi:NitT/TauT family transport system substrate-binding protein